MRNWSCPFIRLTNNWEEEKQKPRGIIIQRLLHEHGYFENDLYVRVEVKGQIINAFTEPVCMALLEYYAFEADGKKQEAINAIRILARTKLREFIYGKLGYSPEQKILNSWKHFHDRLDKTKDVTPDGYFCIFREIAGMIIPMISNGVIISDKVIPDISVGIAWSNHWKENNLDETYGITAKFPHQYPDYYPQAASGIQEANAYPNVDLPEFRTWLDKTYIANKLNPYLLRQTKQNKIDHISANNVLSALGATQLPPTKPKKLPKPGK